MNSDYLDLNLVLLFLVKCDSDKTVFLQNDSLSKILLSGNYHYDFKKFKRI